MIREVRHTLEKAALRGTFPEAQVARTTVATVLEAGAQAFHTAYYGAHLSEARKSVSALKHDAREEALKNTEHLITDLEPVYRKLGAVHTTTDFPLALAQVRERFRRESYRAADSQIAQFARTRVANDFKPIRGIRADAFDRLKLRPEGTDVEYASFGSTEDAYRVGNYELGINLTFEAWINDDIGDFLTAAEEAGYGGIRNRALVVYEAIRDGTNRITLSGSIEGTAGAGGPTPANIAALYQALATQTNPDGLPMPRLLSHVAVPAAWGLTGRNSLNSEFVVTGADATRVARNAAYGLATLLVEPLMAEVMGIGASNNAADWIGFDGTQRWLEFATLRGYEAGPRTFTKLPDVLETVNEGSFDNKSMAIKVSDNIGAKVVDPRSVIRVAGA